MEEVNENSSYWLKKADTEWGKAVHGLGGECFLAGEPCWGPLEAHHLILKGRRKHRHNPMNGILLCSRHHQHDAYAPHTHPAVFKDCLKHKNKPLYEWVESEKNKTGRICSYKESFIKLQRVNKFIASGWGNEIKIAMQRFLEHKSTVDIYQVT